MKVIQVNIVYGTGSTGKIVAGLHQYYRDNALISMVCCGISPYNDEGVKVLTRRRELSLYRIWAHLTGYQYGSGYLSTERLIRFIQQEQPDVVHLHCINGFFIDIYKLLTYLKRDRIPTVVTLHAEFMYTGNCGHSFNCVKWKIGCGCCPQLWDSTYSYFFDRTASSWQKFFTIWQGFERVVFTAVSPWLRERALQSPLLSGKKIVTVKNGIDTSKFFPRQLDINAKQKSEGEYVILHVTAHFSLQKGDLKGGHHVAALAKRLASEPVKILVVGPTVGIDAGLPNLQYVGVISNMDVLAGYYSMADVTLITSSRETFSMPSVESIACGTPVVGFKAGGPETVCPQEYSEFVDYGDMDALERAVRQWLPLKKRGALPNPQGPQSYSIETMGTRYLQVYRAVIENRLESLEPLQ